MSRLPVVLQSAGLAGFTVAAYILWGVGVAVATGSVCAVVAGVALERGSG